jgi:hypothetical protein
MRTKKNRKDSPEVSEEEFLSSAKSYLSEAFPNPKRVGCPPNSALNKLAEHPREADKSVRQHITCCSPCFNHYMEILADLRRRKAG